MYSNQNSITIWRQELREDEIPKYDKESEYPHVFIVTSKNKNKRKKRDTDKKSPLFIKVTKHRKEITVWLHSGWEGKKEKVEL